MVMILHEWMYREWMHHFMKRWNKWLCFFMNGCIMSGCIISWTKGHDFLNGHKKSINKSFWLRENDREKIICLKKKTNFSPYPQSWRSVDSQDRRSSIRGATLRRKLICSILGGNYSKFSSTRVSKFVLRKQREFVELRSIFVDDFPVHCDNNIPSNW